MKIQISYIKSEEKEAAAAVAALRAVFSELDPKRKDNHPPRRHIYIAIPEPQEKLDFSMNL